MGLIEHAREVPVPKSEWEWFGYAAHYICRDNCLFHLSTKVGPWIVSSVGNYIPRAERVTDKRQMDFQADHPFGDTIGAEREFETMVFRCYGECGCGCGLPTIDGHEIDYQGYRTPKDAQEGHMALCEKWAAIEAITEEEDHDA